MADRGLVWILIPAILVTAIFVDFNHRNYCPPVPDYPNYEAIALVTRVDDGDSIEVEISEVKDPHRGLELGREQVRLAQVDAEEMFQRQAVHSHPEVRGMSQSDYEGTIYYRHALAAKNVVKSLASPGTKVYLDIDDLARGYGPHYNPYRGNYDRLIAVVYVRRGGGWININAAVLRNGYPDHVRINRFRSEFNANSWLRED